MKKNTLVTSFCVVLAVVLTVFAFRARMVKNDAPLPTVAITSNENTKTVPVRVGQHFTVTLGDTSLLGYSIDRPEYDTSLIHLDTRDVIPPADAALGHAGSYVWTFTAVKAGATDLTFTASRSTSDKMDLLTTAIAIGE